MLRFKEHFFCEKNMEQEYRGWIPNVAGRLSYSTIGSTGYPDKCSGYNLKTLDGGRILVQMQRRQLDDSVILPRLFAPYLRSDASFYFFIVGELQQSTEKLTGHIAMMLKSSPRLQDAMNCAKDNKIESREKLTEITSSETYSASFILERDGYLKIVLKDLPNAEFNAFSGEKKDKLLALAAELYFFIRDITHHHNHHAQSSDRILDIVAYDAANSGAMANKQDEWLTKSFTDLRNRIIAMRRTKSGISASPIGILAYAESLQEIYARRKINDPTHYPGRQCVDDANLKLIRQSIEASDRTHTEEGLELQRRVAWLAQIFLPLVGVMLAWTSLMQIISDSNAAIEVFAESVNVSSTLLGVVKSALEQPVKWMGLLLAFGILILGYSSKKMRRFIFKLYYVTYHSTLKIANQKSASLVVALLAVALLLVAATIIFKSLSK
jgi:hypothetical protein